MSGCTDSGRRLSNCSAFTFVVSNPSQRRRFRRRSLISFVSTFAPAILTIVAIFPVPADGSKTVIPDLIPDA